MFWKIQACKIKTNMGGSPQFILGFAFGTSVEYYWLLLSTVGVYHVYTWFVDSVCMSFCLACCIHVCTAVSTTCFCGPLCGRGCEVWMCTHVRYVSSMIKVTASPLSAISLSLCTHNHCLVLTMLTWKGWDTQMKVWRNFLIKYECFKLNIGSYGNLINN